MKEKIAKTTHANTGCVSSLVSSLKKATASRRDRFDVLACVAWTEHIRTVTGAHSSYELEKRFEPEGFGRDKGGVPYNKGKWQRYAAGRNSPSPHLVGRIEHEIRGSSRLLYHPLWEILRNPEAVRKNKYAWLNQLSGETKEISFDIDSSTDKKSKTHGILRRKLEMLERRSDIDSVACMTIFLIEAIAIKNMENGFLFSKYLYRMWLSISGASPFMAIAPHIFDEFKNKLFNKVCQNNTRLGFDLINFSECESLLTKLTKGLQDKKGIGISKSGERKLRLEILHGKYGYDAYFALNPPLQIYNFVECSDSTNNEVIYSQMQWKIALNCLRTDKYAPMGPLPISKTDLGIVGLPPKPNQ